MASANGNGMLGANRLQLNRLSHAKCGICGRSIAVGEVCSWESLKPAHIAEARFPEDRSPEDRYKVRCVEHSGCWSHKFLAEDIASKRNGTHATPVKASVAPVDVQPVAVESEAMPESQGAASSANAFGVLADAIAPYLDARLRAKVDQQQVSAIVAQAIIGHEEKILDSVESAIQSEVKRQFDAYPPIKIECRSVSGEVNKVSGHVHAVVPEVITLFASGAEQNIYLWGAPGAGKTHMAQQIADALGVPLVVVQLSKVSPESALKGFVDANGSKQEQLFVSSVSKPCLMFFDEYDRWGVHLHALMN